MNIALVIKRWSGLPIIIWSDFSYENLTMKQEQVKEILTMDGIDIFKLRSKNGLSLYRNQLFMLLSSATISVNALAKLSWHTAASIKKEIAQ